jgi:hypothetical protein
VVEVAVPGRHRQPVRLAHRRSDAHGQRKVQVEGHPPDDEGLLGVLLSEVGHVGQDDVEQLEHDRRHPAEVTRAGLAAEGVLELRHLDDGPRVRWVHFVGGRGEDQVGTDGPAELAVGIKGARVARKVFVRPELGGIDEDRHDGEVAFGPRGPDQAGVAGV